MFVGRLVKQKAIKNLIRAFASVASAKTKLNLVIIGRGKEENNLKKEALRLGVIERHAMRAECSASHAPPSVEGRRRAQMRIPSEVDHPFRQKWAAAEDE